MEQKILLSNLLKRNPRAVIVGSLGTISNDLDTIEHKYKICVRGAMGCAMAVGLGIALNSRKKVIVIIGDGSFLMKMGSISTIMKYAPKNLEVHIINNEKYQSTGGQETTFSGLSNLDYFGKHFKSYAIKS